MRGTGRTVFRLLFIAIFDVLAGCSSDLQHGTVGGKVTLDGRPLAAGLIRFVPVDGQTATADATIVDGEFTARMPIGEKCVTISAPKVVGKRKAYETADSPTIDIVEELLAARYNARSELMLSVTAGEQSHDFTLNSDN
jgi:hypothetical protein